MSLHARAWRWLAGDDGPGRRGLPIAEVMAPLPIAALAVLVGNDWLLKPSRVVPGWLTGKLSDVAGLVLFPLLVTAIVDLALVAAFRLGANVDFTLRRWKLAVSIAATAAVFAALKLSPALASHAAAALAAITGRAAIVADPTDLLALPALAVAAWHGRRAIARVPTGRLELAERATRTGRPLAPPFADAAACGAPPDAVAALDAAFTAWLAGGPAPPVAAALDRLRQ